MTVKQVGPKTGDSNQFDSIEAVLQAFRKQVSYFIEHLVIYDNIIDHMHAEIAPVPLYSILTKDCLEKGVDFDRGGARYNWVENSFVGLANLADSMVAIK